MRMLIQHKIQAGFSVALAFLLFTGATTWWSARRNAEAFRSVQQSNQVRDQLEQVLVDMLDTETGVRGFVLTGDEGFLEPYQAAIVRVNNTVEKARQLSKDTPDLLRQLKALEALIREKTDHARQSIALRRGGDAGVALQQIASGQGRRIMDNIRKLIAEMQTAEASRLHGQAARAQSAAWRTIALVAFSSSVALVLVGLASVLVRRDFEKRQAAEAERDRNFTLSPALLCIAKTDGYFKCINPAFTETLGWSEKELLARPFIDFVHSDDHPATLREIVNLAHGKSTIHFENRYRCQDGSWRWLSWMSTPQPDGTIYAAARDVTELRRAREALRRSEENLAVTLRSIGDAVMATDTEGHVTRLNPAAEQLTGWTQAEALGRPVDEVFHIINEETRQPAINPVPKVLATGEIHGLANHTVVIARDGTERPIADSAAPIQDKDGRVLGVVLVFRDVTIEKQAERVIRESERRLCAFNEELEQQVRQRTAELQRSNRALRTLSECNQALVRAQSEPELLERTCRIVVEHGGYRLCSASYAEHDEAKSMRPMAWAGVEVGVTGTTWADTERGRGPTGTAIRTGLSVVVNDLVAHPGVAAWCDLIRQPDLAAVAALPLTVDSTTLGALTIGAAETDAFTTAEMDLLKELANDLAYGIATLRARAARREAEDALRREQEFTNALLQSAADGIVACDAKGTLVLFNQIARQWHGMDALALPPAEWARHYDLYEPDGLTPLTTERIPLMRAFQGENIRGVGMAIVVKGQLPRFVQASGGPFFDAQGRKLGAVVAMHDITERKRAETALRESEERFASAFEFAAIGKALVAPDGRWLKVNRAVCELTGYTADELLTKTFQDITHPDDLQADLEFVRQMLAGERQTYQLEKRYFRKQRQVVWVLLTVSLVRDGQGKPLYFIAQIQDITARKQAEEALRAANERATMVLESISDGFFAMDQHLVVTHFNRAAEKLLGRSVREVLGHNLFEAFPEAKGSIFEEKYTWAAREQQPVAFETHFDVSPYANWYDVHAYPVGNGVSVFFRVVTERKRAEEQLRLQSDALQAAANAIVICDHDGTIRWVNHAFTAMTGYSADEIIGQNPRILRSGQQDRAFYKEMWDTILSGHVWRGEIVNMRKDGSLYQEEMSITPVRAGTCETSHFIAIKQDVTQAKETQRRLQRSQRLQSLGTLAGGIAHDLNNALAPILMSMELIRMEHPAGSRMLDTVQASAMRAADMVRQLLTFAKGAEGARVSINPKHLLKEMRGIIQSSFPKNIRLETRSEQNLPTVLGDATQLHQVLLNLCVNARDAMPHGGRLTLEVEQQEVDAVYAASAAEAKPGKYVVLRVRDTGTGIPAEVLDHIFEPFFTTKAPDKGTGLGLSMVIGIVKGHGGFIQVYSELGNGSTFAVYLPVEGGARGPEDIGETVRPFHGRGESILLVDDEAAVREVGRAVLTKLDFKPLTASDGAEGILIAAQHQADLSAVLLDLQMPDMGGIALARVLRRLRPDLPIAAMSGRFEEVTQGELAELGVTLHLAKPFTQNQLAQVLEKLLPPKQAT